MNYVKLIAPAKVNLVLAVGGKLPDGYHEAHTILHALALHDTIEIRRTALSDETCSIDPFSALGQQDNAADASGTSDTPLSIRIVCETTEGIEDLTIPAEDNIVYKAAMRLAERTNRTVREHLDIVLEKRIPHEAGLGGGSSDAAATLKGLALLWDIAPDDPVLIDVAASLGADVPFFLFGGCAYFDGKGDHFIHALEPRKGFLALVRPEGAGVSTKEAYQCFDEDPDFPTPAFLEQITMIGNAAEVAPWNNLTPPAIKLKPELAEVIATLEGLPETEAVVLCGSGSAVAALCPDYESASAVSLAAHKKGWFSRVTSFARIGAEVLKSF